MAVAAIEFLLTERPVHAEIEFAEGSMLEDILPLIERKLPCSLREDVARAGTRENLLSSFVMTRNGRIADPETRLEDGDQIKIFHLLDGG